MSEPVRPKKPTVWESRERDEEIRRKVIEDPDASSEEIYVTFTLATQAQIERWYRSGKEPNEPLIDAVREFRALTRDLLELRREAGAMVEAREVFARMSRILAGVTLPSTPIVKIVPEDLEWDGNVAEENEENPDRALERIHGSLTLATKRIIDRYLRAGRPPDKTTVSALREFRQTTRDVLELRKARGSVAEAQEVFAALPDRVASAQTYLETVPA